MKDYGEFIDGMVIEGPFVALCENCEEIQDHNFMQGSAYTIMGEFDFIGIMCDNCDLITVSSPVPFPTNREDALKIVQLIQEKVNADM